MGINNPMVMPDAIISLLVTKMITTMMKISPSLRKSFLIIKLEENNKKL